MFSAWLDLDDLTRLSGIIAQQAAIITAGFVIVALLMLWSRRVMRQNGLH